MWWKCPVCKKPVDYENQLHVIFDENDNEALFNPELGMWLHTIMCDCGAHWMMSISGMHFEQEDEKH